MSVTSKVIEAARRVLAERFNKIGDSIDSVGVEGNDGEKCWIVHSDAMTELERAVENYDKRRAELKRAPFASDDSDMIVGDDPHDPLLNAKLTPYSSTVGGGLRLCDDKGRVRFMVMLCGISDGITKEENDAMAKQIADYINAGGLSVPDRPASPPSQEMV